MNQTTTKIAETGTKISNQLSQVGSKISNEFTHITNKVTNTISNPVFGKMKWFLAFLSTIVIGVALASILGGILYAERKDKDKNVNYPKMLKLMIVPCLFTGFAITLLVVSTIIYKNKYPIELLILSAIFIAGFLSSITTKNPFSVFVGIGGIFLYLGGKSIVILIDEKIKEIKNKRLEKLSQPITH